LVKGTIAAGAYYWTTNDGRRIHETIRLLLDTMLYQPGFRAASAVSVLPRGKRIKSKDLGRWEPGTGKQFGGVAIRLVINKPWKFGMRTLGTGLGTKLLRAYFPSFHARSTEHWRCGGQPWMVCCAICFSPTMPRLTTVQCEKLSLDTATSA